MTIILLTMKMDCLWGEDLSLSERFFKANAAYKNGQYEEAIQHYENILSGGWASGSLFYNLGNSYYKHHQIGRAILNYERAKFWMPRDHDLLANSRYVFSLSNDAAALDRDPVFIRFVNWLIGVLTVDELTLLTVILFLVLGALSLWGMLRRWPRGQFLGMMTVFMGMLLVFILGHVVKLRQFHQTWIVVQDTAARFEPRAAATTHYDLFAGARITLLSSADGWMKIKRIDDKIGWVPKETVEKLAYGSVAEKADQ
jgi:tetratricopeptide (TPR) repeat protein